MDMELKSQSLLTELQSGAITQDQFQRKCLEWAFEIWDSYTPLPLPFRPQKVIEYFSIPEKERKNLKSDYYLENEEVNKWLGQANYILHHNIKIAEWLKSMLPYCETSEETAEIEEKISEYKKVITDQAFEINQKNIGEWLDGDEIVRKYKDFFEGEVIE